jgi:hypothetical protein
MEVFNQKGGADKIATAFDAGLQSLEVFGREI